VEISSQKKKLREELRAHRATTFTQESWLHLLSAKEIQAASVIASYISYGVEPETSDLNLALISQGKKLLLPRTLKNNDLEWVHWDANHSTLKKNGKVLEPTGQIFSDEGAIDVVITPSLCIDRTGTRLGQGGGSYDRALARLSHSCWKVGLIYAGELRATPLPAELHDQKLDAASTPHLVTRFYSER